MPIDGHCIGSQIEKCGSCLRKEIFIQQGPGSSTSHQENMNVTRVTRSSNARSPSDI